MYHAMLCIRPSTDIHCTSTAQVTMLSRAVYSGSGGRGGGGGGGEDVTPPVGMYMYRFYCYP